MEYVLDAYGAAYVDKYTINECGLPGILLMEHAAQAVVDEIIARHDNTAKVLCIVGKGNNGGDAVAVGRLLNNLGYEVTSLQLSEKVSDDLELQLRAYTGLGGCLVQLNDENTLSVSEKLAGFTPDVIVDGVFGTGLKSAPEGVYKDVISYVNQNREENNELRVYSIDIPSGVNCSDGTILGVCIKADVTVTFGYKKKGHLLYPGRAYCGELCVHDIGFDKNSADNLLGTEHIAFCLSDEMISRHLPVRHVDSNKGSYGRVLILAGSDNMPGACVLASKTALRCGCGLVTVCSSEKVLDVVAGTVPEAILCNNRELPDFSSYTTCLVGPGLGKSGKSMDIVMQVLESGNFERGLVFDADAINILSDKLNVMNLITKEERLSFIETYLPENIVFTPHKKELSRLFNIPMEELASLISTAKWLMKNSKNVFVLKDAVTLVAGRNKVFINTTGNNGMSTAGAGDVLGGIITSFMAQSSDAFEASCLGVYIHGLAGDNAREKLSEYGIMAGDISDEAAKLLIK